jgi:hypothetical protein
MKSSPLRIVAILMLTIVCLFCPVDTYCRGTMFRHEWVQIGDGTMNAVRLADDLTKPVGEPILLSRASDASWCRPVQPEKYVTDGPCFYRLKNGPLLMLAPASSRPAGTERTRAKRQSQAGRAPEAVCSHP